MNWKASLPRGNPPTGRAFVCFGVRDANGVRIEMNGEIDDKASKEIMDILVRQGDRKKEPADK